MTGKAHVELPARFVATLERALRFVTRLLCRRGREGGRMIIPGCRENPSGVPLASRPVSAVDLQAKLDRIGSEWTLSHLLQSLVHVGVPGLVRHRILGEVLGRSLPAAADSSRTECGKVDHLLTTLGIPQDRRTDYLACLYTQYEGVLARRQDCPLTFQEFSARWLIHELEMMRRFVPLYFDVAPRLDCIPRAAALWFGEEGAKTLPCPVGPSRSTAKGGRG
jgi:hypothetical protein